MDNRPARKGQINFVKLLQSWVLIALGVLIASSLSDGVHYDSRGTLVLVVLLLSLFNLVIRPVLILFALPFVVLTFGFGLVVINALVLLLVEAVVPGFQLASFWSALWVALVISLVSLAANLLVGGSRVKVTVRRSGPPGKGPDSSARKNLSGNDDDVIDI
ncbi:phage holin family protein [Ruficoccus amylovorans]|uniref:Phage holin family protein n=1 Tax=Ruficoccus amylovorans TaxID=1804625 RepID=A0A842HB56_9BACT|nr:phage holin family protein [Ruficoccus amylovorans]